MEKLIMAVVGNPVLHSLSPVLMNAASKYNNLNSNYIRILATSAKEAITVFKSLNMVGMNVTAPFKQDIIPFLDKLTPNAQKANAVNCVYWQNNQLIGDNSDIMGVEISLKNFPQFFEKGNMLVVGSGGAAPAVIIAGQNLGLQVTVAARNVSALENLKQKFGVETIQIEKIAQYIKNFGIIVQALPAGIKVFDPQLLDSNCIILDANYKDSIFEQQAQKIGYTFLNGKNWLVNQAIPAFKNFTNHNINSDVLYQALKDNNFKYQKKIALIGFMGVGKTTSGKKLAKLLNYNFVDLDQEIELNEGMKINDIFKTKGEQYFRNLEETMLEKLSTQNNIILSCGGGTIKSPKNRDLLRNNFLTIWLYASAAWCIEGLDISNRPLLQCDNPLQAAQEMLNARIPYYADCAYAIAYVENLNTNQISEKIYEQIDKTFGI